MVHNPEQTRFRSFAERYVIERAATFSKDNEERDAWDTILKARSIYKQIAQIANGVQDQSSLQATLSPGQAAQSPPAPLGGQRPARQGAKVKAKGVPGAAPRRFPWRSVFWRGVNGTTS